MSDIVSTFEICIKSDCANCQRHYPDGRAACKDFDDYNIEMPEKLLHDVLVVMKEREAVPVVQREIMHMLVWCCGSCGVAITDGDKFCRMCGRQVKWE